MRCPYWDCGHCYHPEKVTNNGCVGYDNCEEYIEMLEIPDGEENEDESTD